MIVTALLAADAYFWHGKYLHLTMATVYGFGADFNYQISRLLRPLH